MKYIKEYRLFESLTKLYHGNRKGDFPPKRKRFGGCIFLTSSLDFAKDFAGFNERNEFPNGAVWEVTLKSGINLCNPMDRDIMKKLDLKGLIQKMIEENYKDPVNGTIYREYETPLKGYDYDTDGEFTISGGSDSVYFYLWRIKSGSWRIIESPPILERIKELGYDGFMVNEKGVENIAIFSEGSIKDFTPLELD